MCIRDRAYAGSEDAIRRALVERYPREKFQLATKNAAWINCKTREEAIAQFDTSLKQTGAGYFDFYLLHNLGESRTKAFDDFDMWSWIQEMKAEGKIKHIGFSFHSTPEDVYKRQLLGGLAYTIGAILYGLGKKHKYMHSVFHLFILLGSLLQFFTILLYVM